MAKLHRLAGRYDNPMPTWFLAPIAGLKLPTGGSERWKKLGSGAGSGVLEFPSLLGNLHIFVSALLNKFFQ